MREAEEFANVARIGSQKQTRGGNDAAMKMIIKGRSPSTRHISRTHRVNLDWLFDRINLDPGILIQYVNTSKEIADKLTRGSFPRERWHTHCCSNSLVFSAKRLAEPSQKALPPNKGRFAFCAGTIFTQQVRHQALSIHGETKPGEILCKMRAEFASKKQVQKTQLSGKDTVMLSSTERSVAFKQEESEYPL